VLMIVETAIGAVDPLASYNSFLTGIGSSIQMTGRGSSSETINGIFGDFKVNGTSSGLSALNFRVYRFEFAAGIIDLHLPIDASLRVINV